MGASDDDHIGASNEEVKALLTYCGRILGVDYVPPEPPQLSEDAKIVNELREMFNKKK